MTSEEIREAAKRIKASATKPIPCPKCGKPCFVAKAAPHAVETLEAIGYDESCCFFDDGAYL